MTEALTKLLSRGFSPNKVVVIATHNGTFHADEVFGVAIVREAARYANLIPQVIRTRDPELLRAADVVLDVGGAYDGVRLFDHHQRGGAGERPNGIPYSSAGLAWKHFGELVLSTILLSEDGTHPPGFDPERIHREVDARLFAAVDAQDNGQTLVHPVGASGVTPMTISGALSMLNPPWDSQDRVYQDLAFDAASHLASLILSSTVRSIHAQFRAEDTVREAARTCADVMVLPQGMPWQKIVCEEFPNILYVVFPSGGTWRVQAVPEKLGSFTTRRPLPREWGGLSAEELQKTTGVADAVFCHKELFIAGAASRRGAFHLARKAL